MTTPLPRHLRRPRPLIPPPPHADHHHAPINADTLRAAFGAHAGHEHAGQRGHDCDTCQHYLEAFIATAAAAITAPPPEQPPPTASSPSPPNPT